MEEQSIQMITPLATKERFSEMTGLGVEVVRGMIEKGHLPTVKTGKYRLINLALLYQDLLKEAWEK
ncbi:MAG: hypothetical protein OQK94_11705 [Gammaproteobacteria bacterium]|nr:hypothetical protein [Gammaproteobacteria bacterium]MCW8839965.1 hypothetical protein [Gammaproteobacteria bacterium]MCW8959330.1 hypothetical protein [Gammaproteobacteria bacterium]MCW8993777.1 hypothetical protein [Gammaproteobacteria bacterium]